MPYAVRRMRRKRPFVCCITLIVAVGPGVALAQSGSAGGSIGNDEKSLSGSRGDAANQPEPRAAHAQQTRSGGVATFYIPTKRWRWRGWQF